MTTVLPFLRKLTIGRKLELIGAMFALPLTFLVYSVVAEKNIAIDFARQELAGNHLLAALTTAQLSLQRSTAGRLDDIAGIRASGAKSVDIGATASAVEDLAIAAKDSADLGMDAALVAEALDEIRAFVTTLPRLDADHLPARHAAAMARVRDLITRVGDQSNLILDPDLDSFYTMYVVVVMLPELTDRLMDLSVLTSGIAAKRTLSVQDRVQFLILMGQFESARQEFIKSIESAYRGNPDGRLKTGLDAEYRATAATLTHLAEGMKALVLQRDGIPVDALASARLRDAGLAVIERITKAATAELDRLLLARIHGLELRLWWTLGLAAAIASIAIAFAALIGRGISRSLTDMSATMTELAGSNIDVAVSGIGRRDEVGVMARALQVFKDHAIENRRLLDERARQEQELKASEQQFRSLISNIPGVCYRCANDAAYTMELMSDAVEALSGYPASDFIGNRVRTYASLFHPDDAASVDQVVADAVANRRPFTIDYRILHKDGTIRSVHEKGQGDFDDDGKLLHLDGAIFDVTAHRHLEQELASKEQLATIGTVAATVSHELRNPLAAIRNSLATIQMVTRDRSLGIERALQRADRNIERCAGIIDDLLEYTQARDLDRRAVDVDEWLAAALGTQQLQDGIALTSELTAGSQVSIDSELLTQAVARLTENAAQALTSPTWRPHHDNPPTIAVAAATAGPHIRLTIADNGPGIPADVLPRVFEPMFTTRNFGVGLGLPIARQIIERHGGTISIESPPGQGTIATIWLPRQTQHLAHKPMIDASSVRQQRS